jgi:hypothetical protein
MQVIKSISFGDLILRLAQNKEPRPTWTVGLCDTSTGQEAAVTLSDYEAAQALFVRAHRNATGEGDDLQALLEIEPKPW